MKSKPTPCPRCNGTGTLPDWRAKGAEARAMRVELGLSLREMALAAGCSHVYVRALERGEWPWTGPAAVRILSFLRKHLRGKAKAFTLQTGGS